MADKIDFFPRGAQIFEAVTPVVVGAGVLVQRQAWRGPLSGWLLVGLALLPCALLFIGVRLPTLVLAAAEIGAVAGLLRTPVVSDLSPFLLLALATYVGLVEGVAIGAAVTAAAIAVPTSWDAAGRFGGSLVWAVGIGLGWGVGTVLRHAHGLLVELKATQTDLAVRAAADERQRIAREVHDVIAHSLTVTMLHLTAARLALRSSDPDEAADALVEAERLGLQSLADIRRTVGLLAPAAGGGTAAPMPSAADIVELVEGYAAAGLDVRYQLSGDPAALSLATGLGLYRIAQESLTNVAKHAGVVPTVVALVVGHETVRLLVRNGGSALGRANGQAHADGGGLGLQGMRERANLLGGTLHAGPDGEGWLVEVVVPRTTEAA